MYIIPQYFLREHSISDDARRVLEHNLAILQQKAKPPNSRSKPKPPTQPDQTTDPTASNPGDTSQGTGDTHQEEVISDPIPPTTETTPTPASPERSTTSEETDSSSDTTPPDVTKPQTPSSPSGPIEPTSLTSNQDEDGHVPVGQGHQEPSPTIIIIDRDS